ncbi:unnamed protein product [Prunus brigantina]
MFRTFNKAKMASVKPRPSIPTMCWSQVLRKSLKDQSEGQIRPLRWRSNNSSGRWKLQTNSTINDCKRCLKPLIKLWPRPWALKMLK